MNIDTVLLFCTMSFLLAITPGPTMLLALSNGIARGAGFAIYGIIGATCANSLLILLVAFGLGSLLSASDAIFNLTRFIGVLYLCWLGIKLWRSHSSSIDQSSLPAAQSALTPIRAFVRSASVALSNPKGLLFFSAFLPQFINPLQSQIPQYLLLGGIFISIDAVVMLIYAHAGMRAVRYLSARGLLMLNRCCAIAMFILAGMLAKAQRFNV